MSRLCCLNNEASTRLRARTGFFSSSKFPQHPWARSSIATPGVGHSQLRCKALEQQPQRLGKYFATNAARRLFVDLKPADAHVAVPPFHGKVRKPYGAPSSSGFGPPTHVTAMAIVADSHLESAPSAIAATTSALTAEYASIMSGGMPSTSALQALA